MVMQTIVKTLALTFLFFQRFGLSDEADLIESWAPSLQSWS